jgi:hypothetical protein
MSSLLKGALRIPLSSLKLEWLGKAVDELKVESLLHLLRGAEAMWEYLFQASSSNGSVSPLISPRWRACLTA